MANPFGSTPVVAQEPPEKRRKLGEELALALIPQLIGTLTKAGELGAQFGMNRHLQTRGDQQAGSQKILESTLKDREGFSADPYGMGGAGGGRGSGGDVSPEGLRGAGKLVEQPPRFLEAPKPAVGDLQSTLFPMTVPPPKGGTTKQTLPPTTSAPLRTRSAFGGGDGEPTPRFSEKPAAAPQSVRESVKVSLSERAPELAKFTTPYSQQALEAGMEVSDSLLPMTKDAAAAAREATHRGTAYNRGIDKGMGEASASEPYNPTVELHRFEDEFFTLPANKSADINDYRQRVNAYNYAKAKVRSDPRYSAEQERALGVQMLGNLAKDQAAQASYYANAAQSGAQPLVHQAGQAMQDARAAMQLYYSTLTKPVGKGERYTLKNYMDEIGLLTDARANLGDDPKAVSENDAALERLHKKAERADLEPLRQGAPAVEGKVEAGRTSATMRAQQTSQNAIALAERRYQMTLSPERRARLDAKLFPYKETIKSAAPTAAFDPEAQGRLDDAAAQMAAVIDAEFRE